MIDQAIERAAHLAAPTHLVADTRAEFRAAALEHLEHASRIGAHTLVIDLAATTEIDASGLGILVLLQKRARERGMGTSLEHPSDELRRMLALTRLDYLFAIGD